MWWDPHVSTFVAWVNPGQHAVTFAPGTPDAQVKTIEVHAGDLVDVAPPPPPATPPAPPATASVPAPAAQTPAATPPPPPVTRTETEHPFSPVLVYVAGGLTLAAGIVSIPLENHAWSLHDQYAPESPIPSGDRSSFDDARTLAYGAIGATIGLGVLTAALATIGLGVLTAALATWYFVGTSHHEVIVTPGGVAGRF